MTDSIKGFQGDFRFLTNFYPCKVEFEGLIYKSSEAAYQASKSLDFATRQDFCSLKTREARNLGQQIACRTNWEEEKLNVMYRILRAKFTQDPGLKFKLLSTEDAYLEETNYWHDTFWGVYNSKGENHLGRLLMVVRDELREGTI